MAAQRLGRADVARPSGTLLWIYLAAGGDPRAAAQIVARLETSCTVLVTRDTAASDHLFDPDTIMQAPPMEADRMVDAFLDHWRPDTCVWIGAPFAPVLLAAVAQRAIPALAFDATAPDPGAVTRRWLGGRAPTGLQSFDRILARSQTVADALVADGAVAGVIEMRGRLGVAPMALPCNQTDWTSLTAAFEARPAWMAAAVAPDEIEAVLAAHKFASRLSHRLLLILAPDDPEAGSDLLARTEADGWHTVLRSVDVEPGPECQVIIVDTPDELGLWYRLAPVAFIGHTLAGPFGGRSPFEAASLGSVVVHGPQTGAFPKAYAALSKASACITVADPAALGPAVERLLSPDRAAEIANAAWSVVTEGAEATDRALDLVQDALDGVLTKTVAKADPGSER